MTDFNVISPAPFKSTALDPALQTKAASDNATLRADHLAQAIEQKEREIKSAELLDANQTQQTSKLSPEDSADAKKDLDRKMEDLNQQLQVLKNYLRFEKDEDTQKMVVFIKNSETDELIRQIPSEEFLTISKNISDFLEMRQALGERLEMPKGLLTDETV